MRSMVRLGGPGGPGGLGRLGPVLGQRWFRVFALCTSLQRRLRCSWRGHSHTHPSVQAYVQQLMEEFTLLDQRLDQRLDQKQDQKQDQKPDQRRTFVLSESERRAMVLRHAELQPLAKAWSRVEQTRRDHEEVLALLQGAEEEDEQMSELLKEEEAQLSQITHTTKQMVKLLVPVDPLDDSDVILEVVSGRTTGGDICQQFTREVFHMYQGYAHSRDWDWEVVNYTPSDFGGLHHAAVRISGDAVYRHLKHEGGTHRVQRIPEVGLSSRMQKIHTGTMTVIVLPQPPELDLTIDQKELRVDTFRSRGAGGQSVNTTDSAVRLVHLPTGISAECQQSRSQLQNRDTAMRVLKARLYQSIVGREAEQRSTARKQQVGSRSQSDRIRTYNFSQDRVTDHRTGHTSRDIKEFMRGGEALHELIQDLRQHAQTKALMDIVEASLRVRQG
uniref:Prokaryotic-type class I peptide chain release factors domain-containing protein n=1 Tax=Knipowitschia caucasica TaxID=637954 RepID=A0AAV2LDE8_KNICA